jgi:hypothetical protein
MARHTPVIQVRQHIWMEGCLWKQRNTGHTQHDIQLCAAKVLHYKSSQVVAYNSDTESQEVTSAICFTPPQFRRHHRSGQSHWLPAKQVESPWTVITGQVNHWLPAKQVESPWTVIQE